MTIENIISNEHSCTSLQSFGKLWKALESLAQFGKAWESMTKQKS
jgi:hypothetical protein